MLLPNHNHWYLFRFIYTSKRNKGHGYLKPNTNTYFNLCDTPFHPTDCSTLGNPISGIWADNISSLSVSYWWETSLDKTFRSQITLLPFLSVTFIFMKKLPGQNPSAIMFSHIQLYGRYYNTNSKLKTGKMSFPLQLQFEIYIYMYV